MKSKAVPNISKTERKRTSILMGIRRIDKAKWQKVVLKFRPGPPPGAPGRRPKYPGWRIWPVDRGFISILVSRMVWEYQVWKRLLMCA